MAFYVPKDIAVRMLAPDCIWRQLMTHVPSAKSGHSTVLWCLTISLSGDVLDFACPSCASIDLCTHWCRDMLNASKYAKNFASLNKSRVVCLKLILRTPGTWPICLVRDCANKSMIWDMSTSYVTKKKHTHTCTHTYSKKLGPSMETHHSSAQAWRPTDIVPSALSSLPTAGTVIAGSGHTSSSSA
jgi:hypothetical protein